MLIILQNQAGTTHSSNGNSIHQLLAKALFVNPLSANPTKWPNTLKQFVGKLPTNCLSVFGHFVGLALKGLMSDDKIFILK